MLYFYSIKSPATKEKYLLRLGKFLVYLNFQGILEDKARAFARKGKDNGIRAFNSIIRFIQFQIISERVHVSDILPNSCLRRQYYGRIMPEETIIDDSQVRSFVRGEASEHIITALANIGAAQVPIEMDGIVAHPDIMVNDKLIIKLKNTAGNRLTLDDTTFQSYVLQLLYYIVMTKIEKGILAIRYEIKDLLIYVIKIVKVIARFNLIVLG